MNPVYLRTKLAAACSTSHFYPLKWRLCSGLWVLGSRMCFPEMQLLGFYQAEALPYVVSSSTVLSRSETTLVSPRLSLPAGVISDANLPC